MERDRRLLLLHEADTVLVVRSPIAAGERIVVEDRVVRAEVALPLGHKLARHAISEGEPIMKYGLPIGVATTAIAAGAHVHLHNVRSAYTPSIMLEPEAER